MQVQKQEETKPRLLTVNDFEVVGRVNESYDKVKTFKVNAKNRSLKESTMKARLNVMLDKENHLWGQLDPVQVNVLTNTMTDGHLRTYLYKKCVEEGLIPPDTKIPVEYIKLDPKLERQYLHQKQYCKSWDEADFISSYINEGNENYISAERFCKEHELCQVKDRNGNVTKYNYRLAAALLYGVRKGMQLKDGDFEFPAENLLDANIRHEELKYIIDLLDSKPGTTESLCTAWCKSRDLADWDEWKAVFRLKSFRQGPPTWKTSSEDLWIKHFKLAYAEICQRRDNGKLKRKAK